MIVAVILGACLVAASHATISESSCDPKWLMSDDASSNITKEQLFPWYPRGSRLNSDNAFALMLEDGDGIDLQRRSKIGLTNLWRGINPEIPAIISEIKVFGIRMQDLSYLKVKENGRWRRIHSIRQNTGDTVSFDVPVETTAIKMKLNQGASRFRMNLKGCAIRTPGLSNGY